MNMNQTQLSAYNKTINQVPKGQGTLVGNWWEERELRDATGIGRTIIDQHVQKCHEELYSKEPQEIEVLQHPRPQNDTNERVLGVRVVDFQKTTNHL